MMGRKILKTSQDKARKRAQLIMKVRCGLMSASEAAKQLGVSRKTYYKWEQRGLAALLEGLSDQQPGRPDKPVNEAEQALEKQIAELRGQHQLLEQKMILKDLAADFNLRSRQDRKKKK
jgi:transposase